MPHRYIFTWEFQRPLSIDDNLEATGKYLARRQVGRKRNDLLAVASQLYLDLMNTSGNEFLIA